MSQNIAIFGLNDFSLTLASTLNNHNIVFLVERIDPNYQELFEQKIVDPFGQIIHLESYHTILVAHEDNEKNLLFLIGVKGNTNASVISFDTLTNEKKLLLAGATKVIDRDLIIANKIHSRIFSQTLDSFLTHIVFSNNSLKVEQIIVPANSPYHNHKLREINFETEYNLVLLGMVDIEHSHELLFVHRASNRIITEGDVLVLMGNTSDIEYFTRRLLA